MPELLAADKVGIKLKQHVGAPCEPVVSAGDRVSKGQVVGRPPIANGKPALGAAGPRLDRRHGDRHQRRRGLDSEVIVSGTLRVPFFSAAHGVCRIQTGASNMSIPKAIGAIEFSSIGIGYMVEDEMLKAAIGRPAHRPDDLFGQVPDRHRRLGERRGGVDRGGREGRRQRGDRPLDHSERARSGVSRAGPIGGLAARRGRRAGRHRDLQRRERAGRRRRAAKAARVTLFRIHVAMALGGKGLLLMTGSVADVRAGVDAAADEARERGLLVSEIVLPRPSKELFADYL